MSNHKHAPESVCHPTTNEPINRKHILRGPTLCIACQIMYRHIEFRANLFHYCCDDCAASPMCENMSTFPNYSPAGGNCPRSLKRWGILVIGGGRQTNKSRWRWREGKGRCCREHVGENKSVFQWLTSTAHTTCILVQHITVQLVLHGRTIIYCCRNVVVKFMANIDRCTTNTAALRRSQDRDDIPAL